MRDKIAKIDVLARSVHREDNGLVIHTFWSVWGYGDGGWRVAGRQRFRSAVAAVSVICSRKR